MKIEIKTTIWETKNWQEKTEKYTYLYGIIILINLIIGIATKNLYSIILNGTTFLLTTIIITSYNKWNKKRGKQKK